MKNILLIVFILTGTGSVLAADVHDFKLRDTNNKRVSWTEVKGEKITIIDFWATWCKPCVKSIPELINIYDDYSGRGLLLRSYEVPGAVI